MTCLPQNNEASQSTTRYSIMTKRGLLRDSLHSMKQRLRLRFGKTTQQHRTWRQNQSLSGLWKKIIHQERSPPLLPLEKAYLPRDDSQLLQGIGKDREMRSCLMRLKGSPVLIDLMQHDK